ncbi:uncharacterized protein PHALS_00977 [Plasmopara halstedii]|uniref:Uncharacterized protein n=1 Tax=Plasmopara halstedii TaxID=4781 RepID=A0A0P1AT72_PLAHL|nr:uncharacterized protein PHALS_00977 [Plasmopara halstedii]CEG44631.1 hypothetical protein PHALS_00977 [Plasmopara halstedii]|eukprot:XP_024581000.1 hypothetical protein PHALS_00977 [Plasmopara halstedii]
MQRQVQPDLKVEGVEMAKYHGGLDESLELFFFHAHKYCQSQNIDMYNERHQLRCLLDHCQSERSSSSVVFMQQIEREVRRPEAKELQESGRVHH